MHARLTEYIKLSRAVRAKRKMKERWDLYDVEKARTKRVRRGQAGN